MNSNITHSRSTWSRIPPYLHRASVPVLIGLAVLQLYSFPDTRSSLFAGISFATALLSIVVKKFVASPTSSHSHTSTSTSTSTNADPKLYIAISLTRATLYAFIADAQLVFLNYSSNEAESAPLVLTPAMWAQFGLAGNLWLLGALLWVMEPIIYLVTQWREKSTTLEEGRRVLSEKEGGYSLVRQEDSEEEIEAS